MLYEAFFIYGFEKLMIMDEIQQKVKDLELALNYVCYDADLIPKLQTVWQKLELLQEVVNKNDLLQRVSARTYPEEYVKLLKPNYLNKNGEIVEAEKAELNGSVIYLANKADLYVR